MYRAAISCLLFLNNAISDLVSIRGTFEVASFRLSKAVEAVTESVSPPVFKCLPMFRPQCRELLRGWLQHRRIGFAGQNRRADDRSAVHFDMAFQIR